MREWRHVPFERDRFFKKTGKGGFPVWNAPEYVAVVVMVWKINCTREVAVARFYELLLLIFLRRVFSQVRSRHGGHPTRPTHSPHPIFRKRAAIVWGRRTTSWRFSITNHIDPSRTTSKCCDFDVIFIFLVNFRVYCHIWSYWDPSPSADWNFFPDVQPLIRPQSCIRMPKGTIECHPPLAFSRCRHHHVIVTRVWWLYCDVIFFALKITKVDFTKRFVFFWTHCLKSVRLWLWKNASICFFL